MATTIEQTAGTAATREPEAKRSRRPIVLAILAVVLLAAGWWGYGRWQFAQAHQGTDNAQIDGRIVPVLSKVGGYVKAVHVAENDSVHQGAVLVEIDDAEYRQRLVQAEAELAAAQATAGGGSNPGQAEAQVNSASGQQAALEAQIAAAQATAKRAQADLARAEDLARQQIISRQQLDLMRSTAEAAQANVLSLQRQASAAGASISSARAGVRLAEARLDAARAVRDNAALQLQYTKVTAPEAGTIARKTVEVGQLIQPGQPMMSIVADTGLWISANFKETQLTDMHVGQEADIEVDAYGGCHATGRVASISSATGAKFSLLPPDNATGNFTKVVQRIPVRLQITKGCGADRPLRPGMSVNVTVSTR